MTTSQKNFARGLFLPVLFSLLFVPTFAHAQCGATGFSGFSGPTSINVDLFGVSYGAFGAGTESEWSPTTADARFNSLDFIDPNNVFASLLNLFSTPVANAQCGGSVSVTPAAVLTATPGVIDVGESSTLTWGSNNVSSCTGDAFATSGATEGTATVSPTESTSYTVSCYTAGHNSGYTWQLYTTDTSDFACPLTDMNRGGFNNLQDCDIADPSGTSCTAGTQNCKTKVATAACTMETAVYSCEPPAPADATDTVTVSVRPTGSCSVSPSTAGIGDSVTWTAAASGGNGTYTYSWSGTDGLTGTGATVAKTYSTAGTKTASVTITSDSQTSAAIPCSVGGGTTDGGDHVTVSDVTPTVNLTATPTTVVTNGSSLLTWDSTNANSCTSTSFTTGGAADNATGVSTGALTTSKNYAIDCVQNSSGNHAYDNVTVAVNTPSGDITADKERVQSGDSVLLTWSCNPESTTAQVTGGNGFTNSTLPGTNVDSGTITTQTVFNLMCQSVKVDSVIVNIAVNADEF